MKEIIRFCVFYNFKDFFYKEIDKEIFSKDQELFHFFFFHNNNLHFSKDVIKEELLLNMFKRIKPDFIYSKNNVEMIKVINNFNVEEFNEELDKKYEDYSKKIAYRIDCIFQTFNLFNKFYNKKLIIYVFPDKLYEQFLTNLERQKLKVEKVETNDELFMKYDIVYWINYYSNITGSNEDQLIQINSSEITKIIKIIQN